MLWKILMRILLGILFWITAFASFLAALYLFSQAVEASLDFEPGAGYLGWLAGGVLALFLSLALLLVGLYAFLPIHLYRAPEQAVTVVSRGKLFGHGPYFSRFIDPDTLAVLWLWEQTYTEFRLRPRFTELKLDCMMSSDRWDLQFRFKINYWLDLRQAVDDFWMQGAEFSPHIWHGIVEDALRAEMIEMVGDMSLDELLSPQGVRSLAQGAGPILAERLARLGVIDARVRMLDRRLVKEMRPAVRERSMAAMQGEAARLRAAPLRQLAQDSPDPEWSSLLLSWTASVVRGDRAPQSLALDGWRGPGGVQPGASPQPPGPRPQPSTRPPASPGIQPGMGV
jgi:hypothetical protein